MTQLVVGGGIAALVAAERLAAAGRDVRLLAPRRGLGGGFAAREHDGLPLELGLRALELDYEDTGPVPPLADYRPDAAGHRPFVGLVREYVTALVGPDALVPLGPPAMWWQGRRSADALLATDARALAEATPERLRAAVTDEVGRARRELGDAGLLAADRSAELGSTDLARASALHHGATLHEHLVAPFAAKVRPDGAAGVPATLRRKIWLPLFWPATLAEAFGGGEPGFRPYRPMTRVVGGTGRLVAALLDRVTAAGVDVVRYDGPVSLAGSDGGREVVVSTADGRREVARRPVLGLGLPELAGGGSPSRAVTVLAWVGVRDDDLLDPPGVLTVVDPDVPAYRVTPGDRDDAGTRVVCVELAHDMPRDDAAATAVDALHRVGLVRPGRRTRDLGSAAGSTFTDPTAEAAQQHARAWQAWSDRDLDAYVVGGAVAFGHDTFDDQVVQGLAAADRLA